MKKLLFTLCFFTLLWPVQAHFDAWFVSGSLRMDYYRAGDAQSEACFFKEFVREPNWGGSHTLLIDTFDYGNYKVEMADKVSGQLMYSRGFCSLFAEWQTTAEAKSLKRSFEESVLMPFPKHAAVVRLLSRNQDGIFESVFEIAVNPQDYFIRPAATLPYPVHHIYGQLPPEKAVDIVLIPDGFSRDEMGLFLEKAADFASHLFQYEPFLSHKNLFNIRAIAAPSEESGVAVPADHQWPQTAVSSSFYTFDSERYCMTNAHHRLRELAALAPYDQIYILTNTTKYGGGGIFNFYCLSSALNLSSPKIIVHEFGHGFAGLGDEYYDSSTSYESFYNLKLEPWEPNITTLVDFGRKWQPLLDAQTPVPTPDTPEWDGITGVFEGGGYSAKGIYRPSRDCLMHTFKGELFCEACQQAIVRMIRFYTD